MRKLLRTVAGVVCGYALMVGLITLVQEGWFGGVGWGKTPLGVLAIAGLFTCVAAATGAVTATAIARPTGRVAAAIMSCLVIIETTTLIVTGKVAGPLWFDLLAAVSLIVAILVGAELFLRFTRLTARESAEAQPLAQPGRLAGGADAPSARRRLAWFVRLRRESMYAVRLRSTTPDDLDFVVSAEQDPDNRPFIIPWPRDRHAAALSDPDIAHRILDDDPLGRVGFVILVGLTNPHDNLEFRRIVVTAKRHGFGRTAVRLVKRFAFIERRAHRLWLDVKEQNHRARSLYESEGFILDGVLRECLKGAERFESLAVMSVLAPEYGEA